MSLQQINAMSDTMTRRAKREGKVPLLLNPGDDVRGIPALGRHTPKGWTLLETVFVDASGWGEKGEPAMTHDEFTAYVAAHPGCGWGVVEAGQFQVYVGRYERKS